MSSDEADYPTEYVPMDTEEDNLPALRSTGESDIPVLNASADADEPEIYAGRYAMNIDALYAKRADDLLKTQDADLEELFVNYEAGYDVNSSFVNDNPLSEKSTTDFSDEISVFYEDEDNPQTRRQAYLEEPDSSRLSYDLYTLDGDTTISDASFQSPSRVKKIILDSESE